MKYIKLILFSLFLIFPELSLSNDKYSPSLYQHDPHAKNRIESFSSCLNSDAINRKLLDWFSIFNDRKYSNALSMLLKGDKVTGVERLHDKVIKALYDVENIIKLVFIERKNSNSRLDLYCATYFSEINKYIDEQYSLGYAWADLVYMYIDIGNNHREFLRQEENIKHSKSLFEKEINKLRKIESYIP